MTAHSSPRRSPSALLAAWLCLNLAARAGALENDFSSYPSGAQRCLTQSADGSKCSGSTGAQLNACLCTNKGNFVYNTASCVARDSPADLDAVYSTLETNCAGTGVTLTVSRDAFMAKAKAATAATTTSAKPTKTKSPTATTDDGGSSTPATTTSDEEPNSSTTGSAIADKGTWSSTAKVGVGVGIGVGLSAIVLLAVLLCKRYRRGQLHKRQQQQQGGVAGGNVGPGPAGGPMNGSGYHQPGGPHPSYMGSTYGGDGSTVAGSIPMQHTGGSNSWNKPSPVSPMATPASTGGYWVPGHDGSNRNSLMPPQQYAHAQQGQPLLAELGGGQGHQDHHPSSPPVELPAQDYQPPPAELQSTSPRPPQSAQAPHQQQHTFSQPFSPHDFGRAH